jgi:hypothetical protein
MKAMSKKDLNLEPAADIVKPYQPTPDERACVEAVRTCRKKTPRVKVSSDENGHRLALDHPSPYHACFLLMRAMGTNEPAFHEGIVPQIAQVSARGEKVDEVALNFIIAVIKGIEPRDQLECMLAAQMGAIHMLTMDFAGRLANADNILERDSVERTLNKLARTFAAQVETLKRYRSNGEQRVTVEHVTVNDGGKAIVGAVTHHNAGPASSEKLGTAS